MKKYILFLLLSTIVFSPIFACTTILVGKEASSTGFVLVGRNEDDPDVIVRHYYVEPQERTGFLPIEDGRANLKETGHTFGYYWMEVIGAEGGVKAADSMLNENGVFIASNNCSFSKENTRDDSRVKDGGLEYNLRRYVAEHATTARSAVDLMIQLVEEYGYAPSGRTYSIADKEEAWMVSLVSGRHYVARRLHDDEVAVISNHYTIHELREGDIFSEGLISYATEKGWYDGNSTFDFAKVYQADDSYGRPYNTRRQATALSYFGWISEETLPFGILPQSPVTIQDLKNVLSIHDVGATLGEDVHAEDPRGICSQTTIESDILCYGNSPEEILLLSAFGHPCTLPYIPSLPLTEHAFVNDDDPEEARENHLEATMGAYSYSDDVWHWFRAKEYTVEAQGAFIRHNAKTAKSLLEKHLLSSQNWANSITEAINTLNSITLQELYAEPVDLVFGGDVRITFHSVIEPTEDSLILYRPLSYKEKTSFLPIRGSLQKLDENNYAVSFDFMDIYFTTPYAGQFEYVLEGKSQDGIALGGQVILNAMDF